MTHKWATGTDAGKKLEERLGRKGGKRGFLRLKARVIAVSGKKKAVQRPVKGGRTRIG